MAQPSEIVTPRSLTRPPIIGELHAEPVESHPDQVQICDDKTCRRLSLSDFTELYPRESAAYLKEHPELQGQVRPSGKKNGESDAPLEVQFPIILDTTGKKKGGFVGPLRPEDITVPNGRKLELLDPSLGELRFDRETGKLRFDSNQTLKLDPSGSLQVDAAGRLHFDPTKRLEFDSTNRYQLRLPSDRNDLRSGFDQRDPRNLFRNSFDRGNGLGRDYRDPLRNLEDMLRPRNSLDGFLDQLNGRQRDRNGLDSLYSPKLKVQFPGREPSADEMRLDNYGRIEDLQRMYNQGGIDALPPKLQKQIYDQMMLQGMQSPIVGPIMLEEPPVKPKPVETPKPAEVPKPVETPKPVEVPKPVEPAKPIDGPKGPNELEAQPPADVPAESNDKGEKLDAFGQSIKDTGAFTIDNFGEAYKEAAKAGAGVAIVVVGRGIPGSEEAIKNVKKLQEENPKLKFLVVDRDKVEAAANASPENAKMKEWQTWINHSIKACGGNETNQVLTSIQSLKADSTGNPAPEKVTSFHWNSNINQEVAAKASLASDATLSHAKEFRLSMDAASAKALSEQIKAAREEALQPAQDAAGLLARHDKFVKALQLASQARPDLLAQRRKEIDAIKDEAVKKQELQTLHELQNAPLLLRAELGMDLVRSASSMSKPEKQAAMREAGLQVLRDAYRSAPELKDNQAFNAELQKAGVNVEQLIKDSANAPRITADQIKQSLARAYNAGDPVKVTEYTSNATREQCDRVRCNCGQCYCQPGIRQQCCTQGGIGRRLQRRCR